MCPLSRLFQKFFEGLLCHVGDVVAGLGCHTTLHDDLMAAATMMTTVNVCMCTMQVRDDHNTTMDPLFASFSLGGGILHMQYA
jgi:hypothetical protein